MKIPPWFRCSFSNFWSLATFKYTVAVIACAWGMWVQSQYRVPGSFLFVLLPAIGLALTALSLILFVNHLLIRIPADDPFRLTFDRIEWWSSLLVRVFVY